MRLFICHASEDKDDFVRPLAEALKKHFDVWFDEEQMTLGDSLLRKIDEGLATCDFGVVVLSRTFFGKKWTQAEVAGLFAREGPARKIILPVWKDVTADEVSSFSPILADKVAVLASEGVDKVVEKIRLAVQVSEEQRGLTKLETAFEGIRKLDQSISEQAESERLLDSPEGVSLIQSAFDSILQGLKGLESLGSTGLRFSVSTQIFPSILEISVSAVYGLHLSLAMVGFQFTNTARSVELQATLFHGVAQRFRERNPPTRVADFSFRPHCLPDKKLVWVYKTKTVYSNEELVAHLVEELRKEIEKRRPGIGG